MTKKAFFVLAILTIAFLPLMNVAAIQQVNHGPKVPISNEKTSPAFGNNVGVSDIKQPLENLTRERIQIVNSFYRVFGNFNEYEGPDIASIAHEDGRIYFYDIFNRKTYAINNDTKGSYAYNGLAIDRGNFDSDVLDEVITINRTGFIVIIDGNGETINLINLDITEEIVNVEVFEVADLDSNGYSDAVMLLTMESASRLFVVINGTPGISEAISVNLTLSDLSLALDAAVGNFSSDTGLEIAIAFANNSLIVYNCTFQRVVNQTISSLYRITTISNVSWYYDALLVFTSYGPSIMTIYNATTLTPLSYSATVYFYPYLEPETADLDGDGSTEIIIPTSNGFVIYDPDVNDLTRKAVLFSNAPEYIVTGKITRDDVEDFVISDGDVIFMVKGMKGDEAIPAIFRKISEPTFICGFEILQYDTGLPDLFVLTTSYLYVYKSDSFAPRLSDLRIYPLRPTVKDGYVAVSVKVVDETDFSNPILTYNVTSLSGDSLGQGTVIMVQESHMSDTYVAYISNLKGGIYSFKINVTDSYDNVAIYDNNGSMFKFQVYSQLLFRRKIQKAALAIPSIDSDHPIDVGKIDGDQYDDVVVGVSTHAEIIWGNNSANILDTWVDENAKTCNVSSVETYVANMLVGASDDILIYYYNNTSSQSQIRIYDGQSLKLARKYVFGDEISNFAFGDINDDGYDDLIFSLHLNDTHDKIIAYDAVTDLTLMEKEVSKIVYLGVFNLTGDAFMDVVAVSYDSSIFTINLTVYTGGQEPTAMYSFSRTLEGKLHKVFVFVDHFTAVDSLQIAFIVSENSDRIFLLDASSGNLLKEDTIPYVTGLIPVDYQFDGIKELAFLLYDNSLIIISLATDEQLFDKKPFLPSEPIAVFLDKFDEDEYEDLLYVLSDEIVIYSLARDSMEVLEYPFKMISSVSIGDFFELPSKDVCFLTYDLFVEKYININMFYRPNITISLSNTTVVQDGSIRATVKIRNIFGDPVSKSSVISVLEQNGTVLRVSSFTSFENGTYSLIFTATHLRAGYYNFTIIIEDSYYGTHEFSELITVLGKIIIDVSLPDSIEQGYTIGVRIRVYDEYYYPVTNANVTVTFAGETFIGKKAGENSYVVEVEIGYVPHGEYPLIIKVEGPYYVTKVVEETIYVLPRMPRLQLSAKTVITMFGFSIGISLIGLTVYYGVSSKITKSISTDEQQRLIMSFKPLNVVYLLVVVLFFGTFTWAFYLYRRELYGSAAGMLGLALMELLLMSAIWLYRDAAYILVTEKMSIKRIIVSMLHIALAPVVIFWIFELGSEVEWFAYYILSETMTIGGVKIPSLYVSLLGTYVTSVIVLAVNIYLNSRSWKKRFGEMRASGTPEKVISEEKLIQLGKMSSSIRIKFLGFLVILGASLVTTTPVPIFLQLGVFIVIPLVFVVIIPYIVSKVLSILGFRKRITERIK